MSQDQDADRKFLRTFAAVLIALGLAAISFIIIASLLADTYKIGPKSQQFLLSERLQPQGQTNLANKPSPLTTGAAMGGGSSSKRDTGQQVIEHVCTACHTAKFMNAPAQIGNKQKWTPRAKQELDMLETHALKGFGNRLPQGGAVSAAEAGAAIKNMVEERTSIALK